MPDHFRGRTITQVPLTQGGAGTTDVIAAPGAGLKIYVVVIVFSLGTAAGTYKWTEGTGPTDLSSAADLNQYGGMVCIVGSPDVPVLQTNTANSKLSIVTTGGKANGWLRYFVAP